MIRPAGSGRMSMSPTGYEETHIGRGETESSAISSPSEWERVNGTGTSPDGINTDRADAPSRLQSRRLMTADAGSRVGRRGVRWGQQRSSAPTRLAEHDTRERLWLGRTGTR